MDVETSPIGTPHPRAICCWCQRALVVAQVYQLRCWVCPEHVQRQLDLALVATPKGKKATCFNVPLPSQALLEESTARNVLWGGQAGPGKSHGVRWWLYKRSLSTPGHEALLLRENYEQLDKTHLRKMEREVPLLGGRFWKSDRKAEFGNGAIIDCGHMAELDAVSRYLSTEYGAIVPDEASLYPVDTDGTPALAELSTRARKEYQDIYGRKVEPKFVPVTNPGGPSAWWLRDMFIDHTPDVERFPQLKKSYKPDNWLYIPAKLTDNPYMREDYADSDLAVLSGIRYKQLAEGDWHAFAGAFFAEWQTSIHVAEFAA